MTRFIRNVRSGLAFIPLVWRVQLAYSYSVWINLLIETLGLVLVYYFWRAVYVGHTTIQGYPEATAVSLMVWARIFAVLLTNSNGLEYVGLSYFGRLVRDGELATELLRPVDLQWVSFTKSLGRLAFELVLRIPLILIATMVFDVALPAHPLSWLQFLSSAFLGYAIIYLFDWTLSCLAFVTTATWGLNVIRWGIAAFLGGTLIPVSWLPPALAAVALHSPFGQALAVPLSLLLDGVANPPWSWIVLEQLGWIAVYTIVSRYVYGQAQKVVTIAGG
ncbi:MAG TPA: ABC-2 family transporter protein [Herpetosiphonaceae bacterium]